MKNSKILAIFIVLILALSLVLASCDKTGEETTSPALTDAPATEAPVTDAPTGPADETTSAPETTKVEETTKAPEPTKAEETTEDPHTHSFGAWTTVKAASCAEQGVSERICSCGEKETESIAKVAHRDGAWVIDKEATASAEGSKHLECAVCKATIKTEVIPANPHTPGEWIVDKVATCTESGSRHRVCTKCGETVDTETISAKGHTEVTDQAKAATCTESGLTEGKHCSVCNEVIKAQQTILANGHSEVVDLAKAATCTESGLTEGKHCSVCKAVIRAQEKIASVGHKDSDWIIDKAATTTTEGSKHIECTVCKITVKTEIIPKVEIPKIEYTVAVADGKGDALSGIEVVISKSGVQVAKVSTDKSGKIVTKLESGDYDFEVIGADDYFIAADVNKLTVTSPAATVQLIPYATNPKLVYPGEVDVAPSGSNYGILSGVYTLELGSVRIPVEKDKMRYIFFSPSEGAVYRFHTDSDKVEIGYYGGSFFVSNNNTGTMLDNGSMELEVRHSQVGNTLVIGLKSTSAAVTECTITIERYADKDITIEELEWTPYKSDKVLKKLETPTGNIVSIDLAVWTPFDATATEIKVYLNETDGYYHLGSKDGPVLYVRLGSKSSYQDALTTIVGTSNLGKYIYDENGNFAFKERYNEIIMAYANAADAKYSIYPLDEDLYYVLKALTDIGWYDKTSPNYIFKEEEIVVMPFNGWLFACVYFE